MTNAEKYLKEGVDIGELARNLGFFLENTSEFSWQDSIVNYFKQKTKPTLTEDERVILRYVDEEYTHIQRACGLWLVNYKNEYNAEMMSFEMYSHLFQFIKERRRIFDSRIVRR